MDVPHNPPADGFSHFQSELLISPRWVAGLLIMFGLGLYLTAEQWAGAEKLFQVAMYWLVLFLLCGGVWLVNAKSERWGRWVAMGLMVGVGWTAYFWLQIPGSLVFLLLPLVLAPGLVGLRYAAGLALINSLLLLRIAAQPARANLSPELWPVLVSVWIILAVLVKAYHPVYRVTHWAWDYFWQANRLLEEARDRQVELQQALAELAHANQQLARLNQVAQNLRQTAEEARYAKEQFVANVSHELRTPLNMIIGFSEMILKSPTSYKPPMGLSVPPERTVPLPQSLLADLNVIYRNARHLADLVDDVLDLSQVEAGRMALSKEHTRVDAIVEIAASAVRPLYETKALDLSIDLDENLPLLFCDPVRIREVLLNLLSNAGRFTEQGGVRLRVRLEKGSVVFSISDTGHGIAAENLAKLFKPFEQGDGSIRRQYGGTGLGLSISKSFIEMHGGKIWVESQEGIGTTFTFSLPVEDGEDVQGGFSRWLAPQWENIRSMQPSKTLRAKVQPQLVVIEKGDALARLLKRYFSAGLVVTHVENWAEAQQRVADGPVRMILVNEMHPMDGLAHLEKTTLPEDVPVLLCSVPEVTEPAEQLGVAGFLVKPISRDALLSTVARFDLPNRTILIVDDEPDALRLFRRMLASEENKLRVLVAQDGSEALHILTNQIPDLILLDLVMPHMDGYQLLDVLHQDSRFHQIPVVLISARDPAGQPVVSHLLAVTLRGGLSAHRLLECIQAVGQALSSSAPPAGSKLITAPID